MSLPPDDKRRHDKNEMNKLLQVTIPEKKKLYVAAMYDKVNDSLILTCNRRG